jgi:hypothetical protein
MRTFKSLSAVLTAGLLFCATQARASVLLSDNFNSENGGNPTLNYAGFANWTVGAGIGGGTVDLIGNGYFDFLPGNGLYVDLDGSTYVAGQLISNLNFAPGTYTLQFDLAGNQRDGGLETVVVTMGNFSTSLTPAEFDPFTTHTYTFTTTGGQLSFYDSTSNDNIGALLDNVSVSTATSAVPEPGSLTLLSLGVATMGAFTWMKRRKAKVGA